METLVCEGNVAVLAVALSPTHWFAFQINSTIEIKTVFLSFLFRYSWCSSRLIDEKFRFQPTIELNDMIPLEKDPTLPSVVIGHNVGFDRTYIKEQYQFQVN